MRANRKKWINSKDELTKFEQGIINAHPEKLVSATAHGERGIGKSMFCFITMTRIFQYLDGTHVDDAYLTALDHFLFSLPEVLKAIDKVIQHTDYSDISKYDKEHKYRVITMDDCGTHMGKYKFYTDVSSVDDLKGRLDTIRDVTNGLLMTTPALEGLLSFLREYPDNKEIQLLYDKQGDTKYGRVVNVRHKRKKWARQGKLAYPPIKTSIWVDNWAYDEYKIRKRKALQKLFSQNEKSSRNEIIRMFKTVRKLNPKLKQKEIIELLGFPEEVLKILNQYHNLELQ